VITSTLILLLNLPPDGSQPRNTANSMISRRPSQKMGMDTPMREPIMVIPSSREFRREAEMIPTGTPTIREINKERNASSKVAGNRIASVSPTGMRRWMDSPRSNLTKRLKYRIY